MKVFFVKTQSSYINRPSLTGLIYSGRLLKLLGVKDNLLWQMFHLEITEAFYLSLINQYLPQLNMGGGKKSLGKETVGEHMAGPKACHILTY